MTAPQWAATSAVLGHVPDFDELRGLSAADCTDLSARIRQFLVESVSRTGGHLGANLSSIELTIALHRCFRSPETPIVWDTGHQTYTHKILTGRREGFAGMRVRGGASGFPHRAESPHDIVENSHASVGPAWAYGISSALRRPVVVVIGDGALTGGVAYEALNAIGFQRKPVVVVVNDNGRSYAATPSHLTVGEPIRQSDRRAVGPGSFYQSLGFAYQGVVDGHDIAAMDAAFDRALHGPLPCVVHVRTQKGYGWQSALDDEEKRLHDVGPGHPPRPGPVPSWSSVIGDLLCEAAENDPRVHAITAAMPGTLGLTGFAARFPERYHDLGIAEQACVAAAAGLASQGMRPFFAVVATFLTRALDQVLYDVALHRLPVVFLLDRAGVTGPDGPSHHGAFDVGMLRNVPGIEIYSPWTVDDVRKVLREALSRDHGPIVIRYPKGRPAPAEQGARVGRQLLREGRDACLVAHGHTVTATLEAARILSDRDRLNCSVWRLSRIHPLDPAMVRYVADQRLVIPVEDVGAAGGLAGPLALELSRWPVRPARIEPLTLPAGFLPHGTREELLTEYGLTPGGIADAVRETLRREPWPGPRPG